ncbi:MAG TPA: NapC/NirT family cytochrome c [Terriglobales bacterium]|nr:NapC/NirT family cytochrome c [Terriglobales bacterium]
MSDANPPQAGESVPSPPPAPSSTSGLFRNPISLIGAAIAAVAAANIIFLVIIDLMSGHPSPYIGILAYMIAPAFLVLGLVLIAVGILHERSRRRKGIAAALPRYPRIDLNNPAQRSAFAFFVTFTLVFVLISAVGSYKAYEFTDSVQFCGQLCHSVMHPEFIAYSQSPHARVACVDCHVGAGAGWYVRSKLSGAYQVYAVAFHKYPRPIPTPVSNLRPAPETCEQCHWPKKFYGAQLKVFTHFGTDEKNTPRQIRMLINTGGGDPNTGLPTGIHWHMNISNEITYIATDKQRQTIPWVQAKDAQGRITVYTAKDGGLTPEQVQKGSRRRMDCVDCHNRPTHIYVPPDRSVDESILARRIDASLPYIKQQAVNTLTGQYNTTEQAREAIATDLQKFYQTKYPDIYSSRQLEIHNAISELQRIYSSTIFPEMKVDWRVHPNNIGHFYFPGCFRCHDGNHVSAEGKVLSKECNICHTVIAQVESGQPVIGSAQGIAFKHPVDLGDMTAVSCNDCHTGGVGP